MKKHKHSLIIPDSQDLVVITGCAHSGIVDIVERTTKLMQQEVLLVLGGFHLNIDSDGGIKKIATRFKDLGVRYVGLTHCTGQLAQQIFKLVYGGHYLTCGDGQVVHGVDLSDA